MIDLAIRIPDELQGNVRDEEERWILVGYTDLRKPADMDGLDAMVLNATAGSTRDKHRQTLSERPEHRKCSQTQNLGVEWDPRRTGTVTLPSRLAM